MCGEVSIHVYRLSVSECPCGSCIFWLVARKTCIVGHGSMVDVSNKIICECVDGCGFGSGKERNQNCLIVLSLHLKF